MSKPETQNIEIAGLPVRRAALLAFAAVLKGAAVDPAVAEQIQKNSIQSQSDRGFVRTLVLALLRHGREAEARLAPFLKDAANLPPQIQHSLWLGYVQLWVLDVKPHAVLNIATELAKPMGGGRYAGVTNAVLRRAIDLPPLSPLEQGRLNLAPWLARRWDRAYGREVANAMAAQLLLPVPLDVTVKGDAAIWAAEAEGEVLSGQTVRLAAGTEVTGLPGFDEGAFWVQDAAAALPLTLLGDLSGKQALDIGAAPGGKTAQLCATGTDVTALDISAPRMQRLQENMERLGYSPALTVMDARKYSPAVPFDLIVLDAPCSATGTLRRHPELSWQKSDSDIFRLATLQAELLDRATQWLAPEGELLFLTCSLEPEEGEAQLQSFRARHPDFAVVPFEAPPFGEVTPEGALRLLPHNIEDGGNDGFFAARLRRF